MNPTLRATSIAILRRLPVSSEILGPVKDFHRTTDEWLQSGSKSAMTSRLHRIFPATEGVRCRPITFDGTIPWQFDAYYGGTSAGDPEAWVLEIPGGRVVGNGAVITPDDRLLCDVSREQIVGGDQSKHSILRRGRLSRVQKIAGKVAVLSVQGVHNYWHWFFDLLPRFLLLRECRNLFDDVNAFVINKISKPYQRETVERLGIPAAKILESNTNDFHIKADCLLVPSVFECTPSRWACRILREELSNPASRQRKGSRIYVSRSDAKLRQVLNEAPLMERLAPLGFEKVTLTGMPMRAQWDLFASAEFVVAPHGAGLTNLLFCQEGTKVLEIFPPVYINPTYWVLSDHLGLQYYCLIGDGSLPPEPPAGTNYDEWFWSFVEADRANRQNIHVNLDHLVSLVRQALG